MHADPEKVLRTAITCLMAQFRWGKTAAAVAYCGQKKARKTRGGKAAAVTTDCSLDVITWLSGRDTDGLRRAVTAQSWHEKHVRSDSRIILYYLVYMLYSISHGAKYMMLFTSLYCTISLLLSLLLTNYYCYHIIIILQMLLLWLLFFYDDILLWNCFNLCIPLFATYYPKPNMLYCIG